MPYILQQQKKEAGNYYFQEISHLGFICCVGLEKKAMRFDTLTEANRFVRLKRLGGYKPLKVDQYYFYKCDIDGKTHFFKEKGLLVLEISEHTLTEYQMVHNGMQDKVSIESFRNFDFGLAEKIPESEFETALMKLMYKINSF